MAVTFRAGDYIIANRSAMSGQARAVGTALLLLWLTAPARADWRGLAAAGTAASFHTPLSIRQDGFPELQVTADYANRPFDSAPYFMLRLEWHRERSAWELQHLHHKIYLENRPPEVERFDVTHGYNLFTLAHAWPVGDFRLRAGAGVVIAHPESTVRGRRFGPKEGIFGLDQYLTGPALILGASREWRLGSRVFVSPELQLSAARARVPIQDGDASAPNVAVHFLIGLGWRF
jgi:hypothetical protein